MKSTTLFLFILVVFAHSANGLLKCYTCSVGEQDMDQTCVTDPAEVESGSPITNCNKKYCTSIRQEYKDPKGKVVSMTRGCEDKPPFINQVHEDETYRFYYRACQEELCNDGTGYSTGSNTIHDQDIGSVIYTQGIGDDATSVKVNILLLLFATIAIYYYTK